MAGSVQFSLHDRWAELKRGRPGQRFQDRYVRARQDEKRKGGGQRLLTIGAAVALLLVAAVFAVFPGPAMPFFLFAGALLASESRVVARFMDWAELRLRALVAWGKRRWHRLPGYARGLLVALAAVISAAGLYLAYRVFFAR